jgi:DNA mismatch endonuclease (patch repair protein)
MSVTRGRDTKPEVAVRSLLHGQGLRYRVNHRVPAGSRRTVDIAFTRLRLAIFIDGCFWHGCPIHFVTPKTRTEFWVAKIAANRARDLESIKDLESAGWTVRRYWEHQDPEWVAADIVNCVGGLAHTGPRRG